MIFDIYENGHEGKVKRDYNIVTVDGVLNSTLLYIFIIISY